MPDEKKTEIQKTLMQAKGRERIQEGVYSVMLLRSRVS